MSDELDSIAQVSPHFMRTKTAVDLSAATVNLANEQIAAKGLAVIVMIQANSQADSRVASNLDIQV